MKIDFDLTNLMKESRCYDADKLHYTIASDCNFKNITDFCMDINYASDTSDFDYLRLVFDGVQNINTVLTVNKSGREQLYSALQAINLADETVTFCSVTDLATATDMYNFMETVMSGENVLLTPWVVILDVEPALMPAMKSILLQARQVGFHIVVLKHEGCDEAEYNILKNPFCVQQEHALFSVA